MYTRWSEKNFSPSRLAPSKAFSSPESSSATRKPFPPPPPEALNATGEPIRPAITLRAASTFPTSAVELGVDRDGGDAHLVERPEDADGNLATVGDQDLLEHGRGTLRPFFTRRLPRATPAQPVLGR